jgi:transposase
MEWLEAHRLEIESGELIVFFLDECHLLWGDICGYVWGKTSERIEVPIVSDRQRQTYANVLERSAFGVVNCATHEFILKAYPTGNSEYTIDFLKELQSLYPNKKLALIWDGASYHRSEQMQQYLASLNQQREAKDWRITCHRLAPNAPEQNPVEDIWLQAKRWIREWYHLCKSFKAVKFLFEFATHQQVFHFPKLSMHETFSQLT